MSSGQTLGVKAQRFRGHTSPHRNVKEKKNQMHTFKIIISRQKNDVNIKKTIQKNNTVLITIAKKCRKISIKYPSYYCHKNQYQKMQLEQTDHVINFHSTKYVIKHIRRDHNELC
eukprot:TRINITY_DN6654_c0_g2_i6.p4 TRINITY_DN6654_c0_g2~~TRINITY_DN6654_c0_g2_i6.p4  ORF type:complete len:122 (+),score=5.64 TRINITY_DN6654_c0_g2_i6:22-366(+)